MAKTFSAENQAGTSSAGAGSARKRAATVTAKPTRRTVGTRSRQIDPAVRTALKTAGDEPLVVMVKWDTKRSTFGQLPVTNRPGGAREVAFNAEFAAEVKRTAPSDDFRIVSTAANVGVATLEASAGIVRNLLRSAKVAGLKLKAG